MLPLDSVEMMLFKLFFTQVYPFACVEKSMPLWVPGLWQEPPEQFEAYAELLKYLV